MFILVYCRAHAHYGVPYELEVHNDLGIYRKLREEGVDFAYPAQTIHLPANQGRIDRASSDRRGRCWRDTIYGVTQEA